MKNPIIKSVYFSLTVLGASMALASSLEATTLVADIDAQIRSGTNADTNYGESTQVLIRNATANNGLKAYYQFDLSGQLGAGEVFDGAEFTFSLNQPALGSASDLQLYAIVDNADAWDENAITWNNAPKNDTASGSGVLAAGTVLLSSVNVDPSGTFSEQQITFSGASISEFLNWTAGAIADPYGNGVSADLDATFIVTSTTANTLYRFFSTEGTGVLTKEPQLNFTTVTAIPEPKESAAFFSLAALGTVWFLRRKRAA